MAGCALNRQDRDHLFALHAAQFVKFAVGFVEQVHHILEFLAFQNSQ